MERRRRLRAMTIEVVPEIATYQEGSECRVRIWKLPGLDGRDHVIGRQPQGVAALATDTHLRRHSVPEILRIPVESVGAANDSEHGDIERRPAGTVAKDRTNVNGKPFYTIVRLAGAEYETAAPRRPRPQSQPLRGAVGRHRVDLLRAKRH